MGFFLELRQRERGRKGSAPSWHSDIRISLSLIHPSLSLTDRFHMYLSSRFGNTQSHSVYCPVEFSLFSFTSHTPSSPIWGFYSGPHVKSVCEGNTFYWFLLFIWIYTTAYGCCAMVFSVYVCARQVLKSAAFEFSSTCLFFLLGVCPFWHPLTLIKTHTPLICCLRTSQYFEPGLWQWLLAFGSFIRDTHSSQW